MIHLKNPGRSQQKKVAPRAKHNFDDARAHLATLTMTPLRASSNAHNKLMTLMTQERTGPAPMRSAQGGKLDRPGQTNLENATMSMDNPGKVRAHAMKLTKPPRNLPGTGLVRRAILANGLAPMTKLTKDLSSDTTYPGVPARKPTHASGNVHASLATLVRIAMTLIPIRNNVAVPSKTLRLRS
jgi:hypothetical protein